MSPVDRVPQILVAVSTRPSPRPSDEVAVAVRVGPSARPAADRAAAGEGGGTKRDTRAFEDRDRHRSLPPLDAQGPEVVDWEGAQVTDDPFAEGAQWVDVSTARRAADDGTDQALASATSAYLTAGADVTSMRRLLAQQRAHSAYSLAPGVQTAAPQARTDRTSATAARSAPRLHVVA